MYYAGCSLKDKMTFTIILAKRASDRPKPYNKQGQPQIGLSYGKAEYKIDMAAGVIKYLMSTG